MEWRMDVYHATQKVFSPANLPRIGRIGCIETKFPRAILEEEEEEDA
jgi:hypothetical protein